MKIVSFIEIEIYNNIRKELIKKQKEIITLSVDLFKKKFWFENGEMRSWNRIEDDNIDNLFKSSRKELIDIFDIFKQYKLIKHPLKRILNNLLF